MMLKMQTFDVVRESLRPILQRALFAQKPPPELNEYCDLLTESEQSSASSQDYVIHFTFPSISARGMGASWGLNTRAGEGPEPIAALRALTADVVSLCPIPIPAWQRYILETVLEPAEGQWRTTIERLREWVENGKMGQYRLVPSLVLIDHQTSPSQLVELGTIKVAPGDLLQSIPESLATAPVTLHYLRRPFLAGPVTRSASGRRVLEGLITKDGVEFPRKHPSRRSFVSLDMSGLAHELNVADDDLQDTHNVTGR